MTPPASAHHTAALAIPVAHNRRCSDRPSSCPLRHHHRRRQTLPSHATGGCWQAGGCMQWCLAAATAALAVMGDSGWLEQWRWAAPRLSGAKPSRHPHNSTTDYEHVGQNGCG